MDQHSDERYNEEAQITGGDGGGKSRCCIIKKLMQCTICLEDVVDNNKTTLKCNHVFHTACIEQWQRNTCPNCRRRVCDSSSILLKTIRLYVAFVMVMLAIMAPVVVVHIVLVAYYTFFSTMLFWSVVLLLGAVFQ